MHTIKTAGWMALMDIAVQVGFKSEMMDLGATGSGITTRVADVEPRVTVLVESGQPALTRLDCRKPDANAEQLTALQDPSGNTSIDLD